MYKKKLLFNLNVRGLYDKKTNKAYFSILDTIKSFTNTNNPKKFWCDLKRRLAYENSKVLNEVKCMKLPNKKGKLQYTEVLNIEGIIRIIIMLPSIKAEMFRTWIIDIIKSNLLYYIKPSEIINNVIKDYECHDSYDNEFIKRICSHVEITWLKNN